VLHIPQKDIEWYTRRPGYYEMVQENLKKLNDTLGDIDMTEDQKKLGYGWQEMKLEQ